MIPREHKRVSADPACHLRRGAPWRFILRREAPWRFILRRDAPWRVILRREAPKGSLSIQGFYGRGATAILSSLSRLRMTARAATQDDHRVRATYDAASTVVSSFVFVIGTTSGRYTLNVLPSP